MSGAAGTHTGALIGDASVTAAAQPAVPQQWLPELHVWKFQDFSPASLGYNFITWDMKMPESERTVSCFFDSKSLILNSSYLYYFITLFRSVISFIDQ